MPTGQTADRAELNRTEQTEDSAAQQVSKTVLMFTWWQPKAALQMSSASGGAAIVRLGTYIKYDSWAQRKCDKTDDDNVDKQKERKGGSVGYYGK